MAGVKKREEAQEAFTWALEDLYENEAAWRLDLQRTEAYAKKLRACMGTLGQSAQTLLCALCCYKDMNQVFERVYVYANQRLHQDMGNSASQKMAGEAQVLQNQVSRAGAFLEPELLEIPEEVLWKFMEEESALLEYRRFLEEIHRQKAHSLSREKEEMLAGIQEIAQGPSQIYAMFHNADLTFEPVTDENGEKQPLTQGRYVHFMENQDRNVRKAAFENLYAGYERFANTIAAVFDANVRQAGFFAKERNYDSALHMALDGGNIPVSVYENLLETTEKHLDSLHRYLELRKKHMGLEELHMYDVYVPMVREVKMQISFEEAKRMVKEGLAPLGKEYLELLQEGFDARWIDVYENEGKRAGAYSWGAYGTHPYVLLNYQENLNNVFTLAHEMGHALHSWYSDHNQTYLNAGYRIFVAEVASTCNEALLIHDLMKKTEDQAQKAYLINYFLEQFRTTLYRQAMFAHFEKEMHERVQRGETLTAEVLCENYSALNQKYFGNEVVSDRQISYEWARIPHFYTPFYVYQYATGFSAAIAISRKILAGEEGIVERYKQFLSGGCSKDPISLLKLCGVDMTTPQPVEDALGVFAEYVEALEKRL